MRFDTVVSLYKIADVQKDGLLIDDRIIKKQEIRNTLYHMNFARQLEQLD